jgi:uncharacterized protein (DUF1501 family)
MHTTRRGLLLGTMGAFLTRWAHASPGTARVIVLWMNGGPSHVDTWDPKKHGKSIATSTPGLSISEHMPRLARIADRLAVVRGMTSREGNHQRAQYLLRTGYAPTPTVDHPSLGAWASKRLGPLDAASGLPAFVSLNGASGGGGFFGVQHGPFIVRPAGVIPQDVASPVSAARFDARRRLLDEVEEGFAKTTGDPKVTGRRAIYDAAGRLMRGSALDAFDAEKEPGIASYGDTPFGKACATAIRLVSAGVRYVEVTLDGWDTHQNVFERTKKLMDQLDPAMSTLVSELERRDLFRETLVVWIGDFGRTPRLNANEGRDHHPAAWSAVLAGARIRRGIVHGETDADGARVVKDAVTVPDLFATIATAIGLDPTETVTSPAGRPITMTNDGKPVKSLLA